MQLLQPFPPSSLHCHPQTSSSRKSSFCSAAFSRMSALCPWRLAFPSACPSLLRAKAAPFVSPLALQDDDGKNPNLVAAMHYLAETAHDEYGLCESVDEALQFLQQRGVVAVQSNGKNRYFRLPGHDNRLSLRKVLEGLGLQKLNLAAAMLSLAGTALDEYGLCESVDDAMQHLQQQGVEAVQSGGTNRYFRLPGHDNLLPLHEVLEVLGYKRTSLSDAMPWLAGRAHKDYGLGDCVLEALCELEQRGVEAAADKGTSYLFKIIGIEGLLLADPLLKDVLQLKPKRDKEEENEAALQKLAATFASQYQFDYVNPAQQAYMMLREGGVHLSGTSKSGQQFYGIYGRSNCVSQADIAQHLGLKLKPGKKERTPCKPKSTLSPAETEKALRWLAGYIATHHQYNHKFGIAEAEVVHGLKDAGVICYPHRGYVIRDGQKVLRQSDFLYRVPGRAGKGLSRLQAMEALCLMDGPLVGVRVSPEDAAEAMGWLADSILKSSNSMGSTREEVLKSLDARGVGCHSVKISQGMRSFTVKGHPAKKLAKNQVFVVLDIAL